MSREDERELNRNVKESGEAYVNALVSYHHAVRTLEYAQQQVAHERRRVEDAYERNEAWLKHRAKKQAADLDARESQAREAVEQ